MYIFKSTQAENTQSYLKPHKCVLKFRKFLGPSYLYHPKISLPMFGQSKLLSYLGSTEKILKFLCFRRNYQLISSIACLPKPSGYSGLLRMDLLTSLPAVDGSKSNPITTEKPKYAFILAAVTSIHFSSAQLDAVSFWQVWHFFVVTVCLAFHHQIKPWTGLVFASCFESEMFMSWSEHAINPFLSLSLISPHPCHLLSCLALLHLLPILGQKVQNWISLLWRTWH